MMRFMFYRGRDITTKIIRMLTVLNHKFTMPLGTPS
jgi:hypothetical protein